MVIHGVGQGNWVGRQEMQLQRGRPMILAMMEVCGLAAGVVDTQIYAGDKITWNEMYTPTHNSM